MSQKIGDLDDHSFKDIAPKSPLAVIDFWAPSCAPCISIGQRLQELAPNYSGRLTIYKVNADECPETAADHGVRGLPTLVLLKHGTIVATQVGALSTPKLDALLESWANK